MAKKRYINTKFWSDNFVVNLNPLDRYLFLYLLTNEHTDICGIYELPLKVMSRETGLEEEMLTTMLQRLNTRIYYIDGWVYIKNFAKHQAVNPKIEEGIKRSLEAIPRPIIAKISQIDIDYDRLSIESELPTLKPTLKPKPYTVAKATPALSFIKNNKIETYMFEELVYEYEHGVEKKHRYGNKTMAVIARAFADAAGIEIKGTFDASSWLIPLADIYRFFNKDVDKTVAYIKKACGYFILQNLSFTPHTLAKNILMIDKWVEEIEKKKYNPALYE